MTAVKAAIITDVHYGFDEKDKLGSHAPRLMRHFARAVNTFDPAFVVDLGDRVSFSDQQSDRHYMKEYRKHFNAITAPLHSILGNHDFRYLSRAENESIMGSPSDSYTIDKGNYHFVFWNPDFFMDQSGINLAPQSLAWLKEDLEAAKGRPAVLFSHVPLDNLNGAEKDLINKNFFWTQGAQARQIMEDAGNVILSMSGHRHCNCHREIGDIHYITQQAFTGTWPTMYSGPARTFSLLELEEGKITLRRMGKLGQTYHLTPRPVSP